MPAWWQYLSAVFLVVNILFFAVLSFVLIKVLTLMQEIKPKVDALTGKVDSLVTTVDGIANSIKETVDGIGGKARGVAGSAELVAHTASTTFERFSPMVVGVMTAIKIIGAISKIRSHGKRKK